MHACVRSLLGPCMSRHACGLYMWGVWAEDARAGRSRCVVHLARLCMQHAYIRDASREIGLHLMPHSRKEAIGFCLTCKNDCPFDRWSYRTTVCAAAYATRGAPPAAARLIAVPPPPGDMPNTYPRVCMLKTEAGVDTGAACAARRPELQLPTGAAEPQRTSASLTSSILLVHKNGICS